jgi:magnesium transporter
MTLRPDSPGPGEPITAHLRRDLVPLGEDQTAGEALAMLRTHGIGERIVYFYVVDEGGRMRGVVPTRRLLMADSSTTIGSLMVRDVITLPLSATVHEASRTMMAYRFLALPVTDADGRLVGAVDAELFADDLHDVTGRQSVDDVFQLIGVHVAAATGSWGAFAARFPWLLANVAGGLLAALLAGLYGALLEAVVVLALFMPVVLALAESVSVQSVSLTLQGLHAVQVSWRVVLSGLWRELRTAVPLGLACGTIVGLVAWSWQRDAVVAITVAATIVLAMVAACLWGVTLPTVLRLARKDPKIASGPIVLALADLTTLGLYFSLGSGLLA